MIDNELFQDTNAKIDRAYDLLRAGEENKAIDTFHGLLPTMGSLGGTVDFHYALYHFELIQGFPEEFLNANKYKFGNSYVRIFENLLEKARKKNPEELIKLLDWFKDRHHDTHEKIADSELIRKFAKPITTDKAEVRFYYKGLIDSYKDKFELTDLINYFANLILINDGKLFSASPFHEYSLRFNGQPIQQKGYLNKGLAVGWISNNLSGKTKALFDSSYSNYFRKLSAHNDYAIDMVKGQYIPSRGAVVSFSNSTDLINSINYFHKAAFITSAIAQFESSFLADNLPDTGLMDWSYVSESNTLVVHQCFANFQPNRKKRIIYFYPKPFGEPVNDIVCLGFNTTVTPYDLRVFASKYTLEMLQDISKAGKVNLIINAVAPYTFPFHKLSNTIVSVMGQRMIVVNQSSQTDVPVAPPMLADVISRLSLEDLE